MVLNGGVKVGVVGRSGQLVELDLVGAPSFMGGGMGWKGGRTGALRTEHPITAQDVAGIAA
jgi:hypothetical protein